MSVVAGLLLLIKCKKIIDPSKSGFQTHKFLQILKIIGRKKSRKVYLIIF